MQPTILKRDQVRVETLTTPNLGVAERAPSNQPSEDKPITSCEKAVRLLSRAGVVQALEVTCSCGEVTVVELEYPESNASEPHASEPNAPEGPSQES